MSDADAKRVARTESWGSTIVSWPAVIVTPVIDRVFPLSECSQAIEYVGDGHVREMVVISI